MTAPSAHVGPSGVPRLAVLDALAEPRYRRLWLLGLCVNAGRWMDFLVLGWLALELTGSPLMVGVAAFCRSAPMMGLGPFAGVLADRVHRGRLLVAVQCLNLGAALLLALVFGLGYGAFGPLVAIQVLLGPAWAVDFPVRRTVLYALVGPARVTNAVSLESVSMQAAKMTGPLLGGFLLARVGATGCYVALAAIYGAALVLAVTLVPRVPALVPARAPESVLTSLGVGLREVRAQPMILAVLAITVLMNSLVFPYQQMLPVFAKERLGIGPERLGLLMTADGLGALLGSLAVAARRGFTGHGLVFGGGSVLTAVLVIGFAVSPWYGLSLGIALVIGLADAGFGTMQSTIVLLASPEASRGRVLGILSACIGTHPLGALWIGFLASHIGAAGATAGCAGAALLLMVPVAVRLVTLAGHPSRFRR